MSGLESSAVGVVIVVLMVLFVGIWIWAWLPYHKKNFDRLARMPMLDAEPGQSRQEGNVSRVTSDARVALDEGGR